MSTPKSQIHICTGVRLNSRYEHSIIFDTPAEQLAYFNNKTVKTYTNYTYLRKSWDLKVEATMAQAKQWSYLYFTNYENGKPYFYFIDNVEYVNDNTVTLKLQLDVIQTYMFNYSFMPCFIERQHTETDVIGEHTVDEGLELGELVNKGVYNYNRLNELGILVLSTIDPMTGADIRGQIIDDVYSGLGLFFVPSHSFTDWIDTLSGMESDGTLDAIVNMWMYPEALVNPAQGHDISEPCFPVAGVETYKFTVSKDYAGLAGENGSLYNPVNNKLYCYPYNFLYVTNNSGGSAVYQLERFKNDLCEFTVNGALSADGVIKLVPNYYKNVPSNYDEGLTLGGYPTCAWDADMYKIWLAQNQHTNTLNMATNQIKVAGGAVAGVASLLMGNVAGAAGGAMTAISGAMQIGQTLAQRKDMDIVPPQARGSHSANVNIVNSKQCFSFYWKCVAPEYAKIIDDYFTMYGYRLNRVQTPNIKARPHYTYIKTIGCHIVATLCNEDAVQIESIYDNGITFWRDGDQIGNYWLNNKPE